MVLCPPERDLERLLEEELQELERSSTEEHVEACPQCQVTLERLVTKHPSAAQTGMAAVFGDPVRAAWDPGEVTFLRRLASTTGIGFSSHGNGLGRDADALRGLPEVEGYEVLEEIGRGAVGIVYRARHLGLNRLVALKMILAGPFSSPKARQRFRTESQAIARLRHPHIVQVYDIGEQSGCLYLSLELVEGGNLADSIAAGPRPAIESARIVADLADAVAYAHSHGVIHRDLKPANVLFRSEGHDRASAGLGESAPLQACELKITDFGLAKVSSEEGPTEAGVTLSGEFLGTPSYTAPEQARGDARQVGPQADVYSLGAILYELLTGRPPFQGASVVETLVQVAHHVAVPPARLVPGVPRDLDTICSKCLEKVPARRFASAAELAADLRRFLAREPILARRIGLVERSLRWVRRRPARAAVFGGSALAGSTLIGALLWVGLQSAALDREVSTHLSDFEQRAATSDWGGARTALERAKARLGASGNSALGARVGQAARDLDLVAHLDDIRSSRAAVTEGHFDVYENHARAARAYAQCFLDAGLGEVHGDASVVATHVRESKVRRALVAALDDWALCSAGSNARDQLGWILDVARRADPDPTGWLERVRDQKHWKDRAVLEELARTSKEAQPGVELLVALGERLEQAGGDAVAFLKQVQRDHPDDFWANLSLGDALTWKQATEAVRYYQAALAIRPESVVAYNNLGRALAMGGKPEEALEPLRRALQIDPLFAYAHSNLGNSLSLLDRKEEALEASREAVRLEPDAASTHSNLGHALTAFGRWDEAIEEFTLAVEIAPKHANSHNSLCRALMLTGRLDEAVAHGELSVELEPQNAMFHNNLGLALHARGQFDEAIERYRKAIELAPGRMEARTNLSNVLREQGRFEEAIEVGKETLRLDPDNGTGHANLGMVLAQEGRFVEANAHLERALEIAPDNAKFHNNLAIALQSAGRVDDAIGHYRRALEIAPAMIRAHAALGSALALVGRWEEAKAESQRFLESLPPGDPNRKFSEEISERCERMLTMEPRIPSICNGTEEPGDAEEALQFAMLCMCKGLHADAARLFAAAFSASPALAEDVGRTDRYSAACCAALAATAGGADALALDADSRAAWRQRARDWLLADLAAREPGLDRARPVERTQLRRFLALWLVVPDLAGLRDDSALAELPDAEREQCRALWRAVIDLKGRAEKGL